MTADAPSHSPAELSAATRRALLRQYKESRRPAGVFVIRNGANGRVFMDASLDIDGLMNRHRFTLELGSHRNRLLQQDWRAHGAAGFDFEVIDRLRYREDDPRFDAASELAALLALWREEYDSRGELGYH